MTTMKPKRALVRGALAVLGLAALLLALVAWLNLRGEDPLKIGRAHV